MSFALGQQARSLGYRLIAYPEIGSTNAEAISAARNGERGPLWLVTAHQTAGRGRRHRTWTSPPGNLAATVVEVMATTPAVAATLGFAAGVALGDALTARHVPARLKWPNDVLVGSAKLSGILLEAEPVADNQIAVVVGIGVNIVSAPAGTPYRAACLQDFGFTITAEALFEALSDSWANCRALWADGSGMKVLRTRWLAQAAGLGERVTVQVGDNTISGIFETIDEQGHLIVMTGEGRRIPISSGDVFFGGASTNGGSTS